MPFTTHFRAPLARYRRSHLEQRPNTVAASVIGPVEGVLYGSGNRPAGALILDAGTKIDDPVARQSRAKIQISGRTEAGMGLRVHVSTKRCCQSRTDWPDDFGERRAQHGRAACRERVGQEVSNLELAGNLKKK